LPPAPPFPGDEPVLYGVSDSQVDVDVAEVVRLDPSDGAAHPRGNDPLITSQPGLAALEHPQRSAAMAA